MKAHARPPGKESKAPPQLPRAWIYPAGPAASPHPIAVPGGGNGDPAGHGETGQHRPGVCPEGSVQKSSPKMGLGGAPGGGERQEGRGRGVSGLGAPEMRWRRDFHPGGFGFCPCKPGMAQGAPWPGTNWDSPPLCPFPSWKSSRTPLWQDLLRGLSQLGNVGQGIAGGALGVLCLLVPTGDALRCPGCGMWIWSRVVSNYIRHT